LRAYRVANEVMRLPDRSAEHSPQSGRSPASPSGVADRSSALEHNRRLYVVRLRWDLWTPSLATRYRVSMVTGAPLFGVKARRPEPLVSGCTLGRSGRRWCTGDGVASRVRVGAHWPGSHSRDEGAEGPRWRSRRKSAAPIGCRPAQRLSRFLKLHPVTSAPQSHSASLACVSARYSAWRQTRSRSTRDK